MDIDLSKAMGLSLNSPYGSLIAACGLGVEGKHIETRGRWAYWYRGWLLIHQTKGLGEMFDDEIDLADHCAEEPFCSVLTAMRYNSADQLPRGKIVAVAWLADVITMTRANLADIAWHARAANGQRKVWSLSDREKAFGYYEPGRKALLLSDIRALPEPVACRGMQGLWVPDAATIACIREQVQP